MSPCLDSSTEGPHRVLGMVGLVSSVCNCLRKTVVDAWLGSCPSRCSITVVSAVSPNSGPIMDEVALVGSHTGRDHMFTRGIL